MIQLTGKIEQNKTKELTINDGRRLIHDVFEQLLTTRIYI